MSAQPRLAARRDPCRSSPFSKGGAYEASQRARTLKHAGRGLPSSVGFCKEFNERPFGRQPLDLANCSMKATRVRMCSGVTAL